MAAHLGKRIAVIDTENKSASKYIGRPGVPEFDVCELDSYAPAKYVEAIKFAEREGYDVIIVDGATQAWAGKDGALEMVDKAAKRSQSGNSFTAWRDVTPQHNSLVEAFVQCKAHLIVTLRAKMEYIMEEDSRGKKTPRKIGMAPVQRDGMEYEFDVVGDMDVDHNLVVSKTRCSDLDGQIYHKPSREPAETLLAWLNAGEAAPERPLAAAAQQPTMSSQPARGETRGGAETDEYGLAKPSTPCPVVSPGKPNAGKRWDELPGGLLEKMYADFGDKMNGAQKSWAEYLLSRRQARKAAEARAVAGDELVDQAEQAGFVVTDVTDHLEDVAQ
jgi:hypothetical protein